MRWGHVLPGEDSAARWGQSHSPGLHRHSSLPRHRVTSSGPRKWYFRRVFCLAWHHRILRIWLTGRVTKIRPLRCILQRIGPLVFAFWGWVPMVATMAVKLFLNRTLRKLPRRNLAPMRRLYGFAEAWGPITGWHATHLKSVLRMSLQIFLWVFLYIHFRRW